MSMSTLQVHRWTNDGHTHSQLYTYITNLGIRISYTITQLGHVLCVQLHDYKLVNVTPMHYSSQHVLLMHILISALDLHIKILCLHLSYHAMHFQQQLLINACMKQHLSTQLASCGVQLCIFILYTVATQLAIVLYKVVCLKISISLAMPCNGSVNNPKGSDISSTICFPTRDLQLLRRLCLWKQGVTTLTIT